ncbi:transmembrane protein 272-like [Lissotriton helveticus]
MAQDRVHQDCQDTSVKSCCCCATQCFKWLLGLMSLVWIALSIAEIVIGSVYLQQCPAQRFIPIYLIVNGVTVIIMSLLSIVAGLRPNKLVYGILALLSLFWFAWLITGSVWTFPLYPNYTNCNRTVYLFTFSILIIQWIVLALSLPAIIVKLFSSFLACSSCSSCCLCSLCSSCVSCVTKG